ncbi:hypothetical protein V8C86DRAFT_2794880, partial [Haematococcus lacustris]
PPPSPPVLRPPPPLQPPSEHDRSRGGMEGGGGLLGGLRQAGRQAANLSLVPSPPLLPPYTPHQAATLLAAAARLGIRPPARECQQLLRLALLSQPPLDLPQLASLAKVAAALARRTSIHRLRLVNDCLRQWRHALGHVTKSLDPTTPTAPTARTTPTAFTHVLPRKPTLTTASTNKEATPSSSSSSSTTSPPGPRPAPPGSQAHTGRLALLLHALIDMSCCVLQWHQSSPYLPNQLNHQHPHLTNRHSSSSHSVPAKAVKQHRPRHTGPGRARGQAQGGSTGHGESAGLSTGPSMGRPSQQVEGGPARGPRATLVRQLVLLRRPKPRLIVMRRQPLGHTSMWRSRIPPCIGLLYGWKPVTPPGRSTPAAAQRSAGARTFAVTDLLVALVPLVQHADARAVVLLSSALARLPDNYCEASWRAGSGLRYLPRGYHQVLVEVLVRARAVMASMTFGQVASSVACLARAIQHLELAGVTLPLAAHIAALRRAAEELRDQRSALACRTQSWKMQQALSALSTLPKGQGGTTA